MKKIKIVLIIFAIVAVFFFSFICILPKVYLAHKYDTSISDYKVSSYSPGLFIYDIASGFEWEESTLVYECKKNGRQFQVDFFDFQFYDSYQMEDVEQWLVEELQDNIDENIQYVNIGAHSVYGIPNSSKKKYKNIVWDRGNVAEIIKAQSFGSIYIKTDDIVRFLDSNSISNFRYTSNDTNMEYETYINLLLEKIKNVYGIDESDYYNNSIASKLYLFDCTLQLEKKYYMVGIDSNNYTPEQEKHIIIHF